MTLYDSITLLTDFKKKVNYHSRHFWKLLVHFTYISVVELTIRVTFFQLQVTRMVKSDASGKPLKDTPVEFVPEK